MEKRARWYDILSVNLFWLGLNIRNNAVGSVFTPYLVAAFAPEAVRNTALGTLSTAGLLIAMLVQPAMGLLSDRSTSRFGRRRPFIFVGVLLDLACLAFIAFAWDYWSLMAATLLIQFSANMSHGALQGLIPDLIPEKQRGVASGVKGVLELIPLILVSLIIANIVGGGRFRLAVLITAAALLVIMLLTMVLVKEEPLTVKPDVPLAPTMLRVLGMLAGILTGGAAGLLAGGAVGGLAALIVWPLFSATAARAVGFGLGGAVAMIVAVAAGVWAGTGATLGWRVARENRTFVWWVVNRLFFLSAVTYNRTFLVNREDATRMAGQLITAVGLATMLTALPGGWLGDRFGHRRMVALSGVLGVLGTLLILGNIWAPNMALLYTSGVILGLATGLFTSTNWALGTSLVPKEQAGRYLGVSNLAGAGAGIVGTGIGGPVADTLNAIAPGMGYFSLFGTYAVLFALSIVSLRWVTGSRK
jgi:MFS family permease